MSGEPNLTFAPWGATLDELRSAAGAARSAGASCVWLAELHRSAFTTAAAVAHAAAPAGVGTAVALAFTRSPLTIALESLDLDELTDGRFRLGLGTGVQRLNEDWHGVVWQRPLHRMRDVVAIVRLVVAGASEGRDMRYSGEELRLAMRGFRRPVEAPRRTIPVYLAGVGPRSLALAGEIADGWISHELTSPSWISQCALPALADGLAIKGRSRADVDVVASAVVSVDPDVSTARRRAAGTVAFYATVRTYREFFAFHGFNAEAEAIGAAFRGGTPLAGLSPMVPPAMVDALTVCGPAEIVRRRLAELGQVVDTVKVSPPTHGLTDEEIRAAQTAALDVVAGMDSRTTREA